MGYPHTQRRAQKMERVRQKLNYVADNVVFSHRLLQCKLTFRNSILYQSPYYEESWDVAGDCVLDFFILGCNLEPVYIVKITPSVVDDGFSVCGDNMALATLQELLKESRVSVKLFGATKETDPKWGVHSKKASKCIWRIETLEYAIQVIETQKSLRESGISHCPKP